MRAIITLFVGIVAFAGCAPAASSLPSTAPVPTAAPLAVGQFAVHGVATTLDARGAYQSVLIVSPAAIPAPAGDLDRDGGAAQQSGATVILGPELQIR